MNKRKAKPRQDGEAKIPREDEEPEQGQLLIDDQENPKSGDKVKQTDNQLVNDMAELGFPFLNDITIDNLHDLTKDILEQSRQVTVKANIITSFTN